MIESVGYIVYKRTIMIIGGRRTYFLLFAGDIAAFVVSLYLTLWLRYFEVPSETTLSPYIIPFTFLFAFWILVFYSAGLYNKRLLLFPSRVLDALLKVQLVNIVLAALFFFLIPVFGIAPKMILVLYLIVSLATIVLWRTVLYPRISVPRARERLVLFAKGPEVDELCVEINGNPRYGIELVTQSPGDNSVTSPYQVVFFEDMYEEVFDRVPLSQLGQAWLRENIARTNPFWYSVVKRAVDIIGGVVMGLVTIIATPFVALALQLEYPGPVFLAQTRIGRNGTRIRAYKFRSMRFGDKGAWKGEGTNEVTRVGSFLRKISLDEFPQFVNVLKGEISLIGPRNDIESLGQRLSEALPYYEARYRVKPGITGWAQINQQYEQGHLSPQSIEETKVRLAYDFYYLKHRSLGLDLIIALKTVKRMFFRLSLW